MAILVLMLMWTGGLLERPMHSCFLPSHSSSTSSTCTVHLSASKHSGKGHQTLRLMSCTVWVLLGGRVPPSPRVSKKVVTRAESQGAAYGFESSVPHTELNAIICGKHVHPDAMRWCDHDVDLILSSLLRHSTSLHKGVSRRAVKQQGVPWSDR